MSGSVPHSIAVSNHTHSSTAQPGYTTYDVRSDEDNNLAALHARNAKASSDLIVTISEQGQALQGQTRKKDDDIKSKRKEEEANDFDEVFDDEQDLPIFGKINQSPYYSEQTPRGEMLDQTV
ncbi:hypothetical protein [Marinomonas sp. THO17]|uniref:hypothetical protein n=1 Tax=Marinomonas sp. THO17 TaxID=3149048 RepID=UPI00336BEC27